MASGTALDVDWPGITKTSNLSMSRILVVLQLQELKFVLMNWTEHFMSIKEILFPINTHHSYTRITLS